jgi:hypothetical protein
MTAMAIPPTTITARAASAALHRRLGRSLGTSSSAASASVNANVVVDVDVVVVVDVDGDGDGNGNVVATVDAAFPSALFPSVFFASCTAGAATAATAGAAGSATTSVALQASEQNAATFPPTTFTCLDRIGSKVLPHVGHTASRALTGTPALSLRRAAR